MTVATTHRWDWRGATEASRRVLGDLFSHDAGPALDQSWRPDAPEAYCWRCGASVGPGSCTSAGCARCVGTFVPWTSIHRLSLYTEPVSGWIVAMKFAGRWRGATWLGERLAAALPANLSPQSTVVCPVPMHWLRRWRRGYNQSRLLAQAVARQRRLPLADLLGRTRYTRPQTAVPASRRRQNIAGSFAALRVDLSGWDVVLVDDVMTTGATARACARLLRRAGARRVHVAVVAVADPKGTGFDAR